MLLKLSLTDIFVIFPALPLTASPNVSSSCMTLLAKISVRSATNPRDKRAKSFGNMGEAAIVVDYVERLVSHGVTADMIAVIAPYNYQVKGHFHLAL